MRYLQGDDEATIPIDAVLAPLFLASPTDPDEMLSWRFDKVMRMLNFNAVRAQVARELNG